MINMPLKKIQLHGSKRVLLDSQTVELTAAIASRDTGKVKQLLDYETEDSNLVNCAIGPLGVTPLHLACAKSRSESLISLLVEEGAKVSVADKIGRSALHYASARGNDHVVQYLIQSGADINCQFGIRSTPQPVSVCDSGDRPAKDLIPEYDELPLPDCWGRTPLHQAVKGGHVQCVNILLQNGASVNAEDEKGLTPLLLAGAGGLERYESIVDMLVFYGAEVNRVNPDVNSSPLYHAVALGSVHATQILLNAGASLELPYCDSPTRVETVLHVAASAGLLQIIRLLLHYGATKFINCCNNVGCTPLHKAAYAGSRSCLQALIDHGGDISIRSDSGTSVVDIIMSYVPRPINFLTDCLNSRIVANGASINDRDFKVFLDFAVLSPSGCTHQMSVVSSLAVTSKLIQNPLVEAFVLAKWAKLRLPFLIIAFIQLIFVISLSAHILLWNKNKKQSKLSQGVLIVSSGFLLLHTATELVLMGKQRLQQFETWLTFINTSFSLLITIVPLAPNAAIPNEIKHIASVIILLGWVGLLSVMGRFPIWGYYALMFNVVLQNVLKVFLTFISLVIGFALSFSVQFPQDPQFGNPLSSLVKTTVMMTGEYDYKDLFSNSTHYREDVAEGWILMAITRIIFLLFVLFASVALMNLMVGIAVSDIQGLQTEGNIRRLQKQADFMSHLERLLAPRYMKCWVPRFISRHRIPTSVTIQPSIITAYEILPTTLLETIINTALQNRRKPPPPKTQSSSVSDIIGMFKRKKVSDPGPSRPTLSLSVPSDRSEVLDDIGQLKQLLLDTLAALNRHHNELYHQPGDVVDGHPPAEDNAISVNAMLRRVSTPRHPVVHQVFSH